MNKQVEEAKKLIAECSAEERKALRKWFSKEFPHPLEAEFGIDSNTILSAIHRATDISKRGVRGLIAEAVFEDVVLPEVAKDGWSPTHFTGDQAYDFRLSKDDKSASIQLKLQRMKKSVPMLYAMKGHQVRQLSAVEVQRTRGGTSKDGKKTRPYPFGSFDILAVSMQPSTKDWKQYRYTVASWLLPQGDDTDLIAKFQPIATQANEVWTDDLRVCLNWFASGEKRSVGEALKHLIVPKAKKQAVVKRSKRVAST